MVEADSKITANTMKASLLNPDIPISEYIRKEFYYNSIQFFREAMSADPGLIKEEIQSRLKVLDEKYCMFKTPEQEVIDNKFTTGDYNRFSSILYLLIRKVI